MVNLPEPSRPSWAGTVWDNAVPAATDEKQMETNYNAVRNTVAEALANGRYSVDTLLAMLEDEWKDALSEARYAEMKAWLTAQKERGL